MSAVAGRQAGRRVRFIGRDAERARVQAFVASLPREARALLIRGEPGIGKTAVWQHAVDECASVASRTRLSINVGAGVGAMRDR